MQRMGMKLGLIGLGQVVVRLAANFLKHGDSLTVFDIKPEPVAEAVRRGAVASSNPRQLAALSALVMTSRPHPSVSQEVLY